MSLNNRIDTARDNEPRVSSECSVCWVLKKLGDEDRAALERALDSLMSSTYLSNVLAEEGITVSKWAVQRHRKHVRK
jgi:hypothetical protein